MWVYFLIGIIVVFIIAVGVLLYIRNMRKNEIENLISELERVRLLSFDKTIAKMDQFNMLGEALAAREEWTKNWYDSLEVNGNSAEEKLEDAKILLEQFKFNDAKENMQVAEGEIKTVQENFDRTIEGIEALEQSHKEAERQYKNADNLFREAKRDVLANGHQFGDSERSLERLILSFEPELKAYKDKIKEGNYHSAHAHIADVNEDLESLRENMNAIPNMIRVVQKELPNQFQDIRFGCRELKSQGYDLEHIQVENTLSDLKFKLNSIEPKIAQLELDEARQQIEEINSTMDEMLELVEHEVKAKSKVEAHQEELSDKLFQAQNTNYMLRTEIDYIKDLYHMNETDVHNVHKFEQEIENLIDIYDDIVNETKKNTTRYSKLVDNVEHITKNVEEINEAQGSIQDYFNTLREDEKEATENYTYIEKRKDQIYRDLTMANLSSIPERFVVMKHEIDVNLAEILKYFERRPINIKFIKDKVNSVMVDLNKFEQEVYEVVYEAGLTELMIQYGNRYRTSDEAFSNRLQEAERLFSDNRYKRALEIVQDALDKVEPGAADKIIKAYEEETD